MSPEDAKPGHGEEGTASVELIAVTPFLLLAVLVAAQLALVGHSVWTAGVAARAGARAALVGGEPAAVARRALPPPLRRDAEIGDEEGVSVRVEVPLLLPVLPRLVVGARTRLGEDGG